MCYERRRAEACVDESAHHALTNTAGREIVGKKEGEQKGSARGSVHWGCYYATAVDIEVDQERGTREEPGTLTQGAPVFPGSSRLGIEPKTPGWLVQDPATRPIGDQCVCVFITAGPITKLFAGGEEESGGHVL